MCWRLEPDEAPIVEFDDHEVFWLLSNAGGFSDSMDDRHRGVVALRSG